MIEEPKSWGMMKHSCQLCGLLKCRLHKLWLYLISAINNDTEDLREIKWQINYCWSKCNDNRFCGLVLSQVHDKNILQIATVPSTIMWVAIEWYSTWCRVSDHIETCFCLGGTIISQLAQACVLQSHHKPSNMYSVCQKTVQAWSTGANC